MKGEGEILAFEDRLELMTVKLKSLCLLRHNCNQVSLQQHSHTFGRKSENTEGLKMCQGVKQTGSDIKSEGKKYPTEGNRLCHQCLTNIFQSSFCFYSFTEILQTCPEGFCQVGKSFEFYQVLTGKPLGKVLHVSKSSAFPSPPDNLSGAFSPYFL